MVQSAYIFPGQGSQFVGMAKEDFESQKSLFEKADEFLGFSISSIMFDGPEEELIKTSNSQPALVLASYARYLNELQENDGCKPEYVAGHSLGEYTALVAAEALSFESAIKLVRKRGELMEAAVSQLSGGMMAVLGLRDEVVEEINKELGEGIYVANYNSPGQVVLSGEKHLLEKAEGAFKSAGAKRVVMLNVSGPFHSPFMKPAADLFAVEIEKIDIAMPTIKYISNVSAQYVSEPEELKQLLVKQIYSPVRWVEVVTRLCKNNEVEFKEIGPGRVLTGLVKKIKRDL